MLLTPDVSVGESTIQELQASLRGEVLRPGDANYDSARRVWNGLIDRKPVLIVRCSGVADVRHALEFARRMRLQISVRSSGHNVAGLAVCDGGLMIDLSPMKGIQVDPSRRIAVAQAGVTWGEFDHETQAFGLATTGGRISTTGLAGLTLGGGYGWLMRKCGLAIDNVISLDVLTADGKLVKASNEENTDLFWGLRGGGGNFGIVTSFEYKLHEVGPIVTGGVVFYHGTRAKEILHFFRAFMTSAPDELTTLLNLRSAPPPAPFVPPNLRRVPVVAIAVCHAGPIQDARRQLQPIRELGTPLLDRIGPMPYRTLQRLFDAAGVFGHLVHSKSGHLKALSDDVIDTLASHAPHIPSPLSIVMISSLGGAVARVKEHSTAFSHRDTAFDYSINSVWTDPAESLEHISWTDALSKAMRPFTSGVYVNELDTEGGEDVRDAYNSKTFARLVALKKKYDPENVFSLNQNIYPSR